MDRGRTFAPHRPGLIDQTRGASIGARLFFPCFILRRNGVGTKR